MRAAESNYKEVALNFRVRSVAGHMARFISHSTTARNLLSRNSIRISSSRYDLDLTPQVDKIEAVFRERDILLQLDHPCFPKLHHTFQVHNNF